MDAISSSTGLTWLFTFIIGLPILLLFFSVMVWTYNTFKRVSFVAYIADVILTAFILLVDTVNMITYFPWKDSIYSLCIRNSIFLVTGIGFMIASIVYYRKHKIFSNISINVSTAFSIIGWFTIIKMANM